MTALAIDGGRVTMGVLGQQWWARQAKGPRLWSADDRPLEDRESGLWRRTIEQAEEALAAGAPETRAWYQLDRGGDTADVLELAVDAGLRLTVRSAHDRRLEDGRHLRRAMKRSPVLGRFSLRVRTGRGAETRNAHLSVRAARVRLSLTCGGGKHGDKRIVEFGCVHVKETRTAHGTDALEWWLLTTAECDRFLDAMNVVRSYRLRWCVEDFHRAWKSGVCNIEKSQLQSANAFMRWATIGAAVAARSERLKNLARTEPDRPAIEELSRDEIDAAILLTEGCRHRPGDALTIAQAVGLIADLGGYTGKSSGGPPGVRVIQRGFEDVLTAARLLQAQRRMKK